MTVGGGCSLRAAIQEANALPGGATIRLARGTYRLTLTGAGGGSIVVDDSTFIGGDHSIVDGRLVGGALHRGDRSVALTSAGTTFLNR